VLCACGDTVTSGASELEIPTELQTKPRNCIAPSKQWRALHPQGREKDAVGAYMYTT